MLDRVREAMFSTLGRRVEGARVLDLFAGSGSLGLEALSRGAQSARMIEKDPKALAILRSNVDLLGMAERVQVVRGDALRRELWRPLLSDQASDLVFLDPPYPSIESPAGRAEILLRVEDLLRDVVPTGGCLVLHAPARALESLRIRGTWRRDERRYGNSGLLYFFSEEERAP